MPSTIIKALGVRGYQRIGRLPIAANQTWKAGDFLTVNSAGNLVQTLSAGNNLGAASGITLRVVGRAIEDAQPVSGDISIVPTTKLYGEFIIAEPGTQFELPIVNGASSNGTAAYPNTNLIGTRLPLRYCTTADFPTTVSSTAITVGTNVWAADISTNTNPKLIIVDYVPDDLVGSTYAGYPDTGAVSAPSTGVQALSARAWCEFLGGQCLLSGAGPITVTN